MLRVCCRRGNEFHTLSVVENGTTCFEQLRWFCTYNEHKRADFLEGKGGKNQWGTEGIENLTGEFGEKPFLVWEQIAWNRFCFEGEGAKEGQNKEKGKGKRKGKKKTKWKGKNRKSSLLTKNVFYTNFCRVSLWSQWSRRQPSISQDRSPEAGSLRHQRLRGHKHLDKKEKEQLSPTWEVIST